MFVEIRDGKRLILFWPPPHTSQLLAGRPPTTRDHPHTNLSSLRKITLSVRL